MGELVVVDFFDVYARDVPSASMAKWLARADATGLLPRRDEAGRSYGPRGSRACEYRGWVLCVARGAHAGEDQYKVTEKGRLALRRFEREIK